jgi:hypothetical protein
VGGSTDSSGPAGQTRVAASSPYGRWNTRAGPPGTGRGDDAKRGSSSGRMRVRVRGGQVRGAAAGERLQETPHGSGPAPHHRHPAAPCSSPSQPIPPSPRIEGPALPFPVACRMQPRHPPAHRVAHDPALAPCPAARRTPHAARRTPHAACAACGWHGARPPPPFSRVRNARPPWCRGRGRPSRAPPAVAGVCPRAFPSASRRRALSRGYRLQPPRPSPTPLCVKLVRQPAGHCGTAPMLALVLRECVCVCVFGCVCVCRCGGEQTALQCGYIINR